MKKSLSIAIVFAFMTTIFFGVLASAEEVIVLPADPTTVGDVLAAVSALIGGAKGATTLVIVGLLGQLLTAFVLSPLWNSLNLAPKFKFLAFAIASLISTIVPLMIQGQSFLQAITGGGVLLLVSQYGHRLYELFFEKKEQQA